MKKILLLISILSFTLAGCSDLDIDPNSRLTDKTAYKTKNDLLHGLSNAYSSLAMWSEVVYKFGATTDEMIFPARGGDWKGFLQPMYLHEFTPVNEEIMSRYNEMSYVIANANDFLGVIENFPGSDSDKDIILMKSEVRFIRAFAYFLMIDYFGNVPLVTTSGYDPKNPPLQAKRAEIYKFVEDELIDLSTKQLPQTNDHGRVDKYAAKTLLAKLYLNAEVYLGKGNAKWSEVVTLTKDIMDNSSYILEDNYKAVFAWDNYKSKEIILPMVCDSKYTIARNISYLFSISDLREKYNSGFTSGWNGAATLPSFYKSYDEKDIRRQAFIGGTQLKQNGDPIKVSGVDLVYSVDFESAKPENMNKGSHPVTNATRMDGARGVKYLMDGVGGDMATENLNNDMPILRFADVMLMRAEALFRLNPSSGEALKLVNDVRTRKGNNPISLLPVLTEEDLLAERGREFAWEGWRRNDLIRFNKFSRAWDYKDADPANKIESVKLFPIPQVQISSNPNLVQNPGY